MLKDVFLTAFIYNLEKGVFMRKLKARFYGCIPNRRLPNLVAWNAVVKPILRKKINFKMTGKTINEIATKWFYHCINLTEAGYCGFNDKDGTIFAGNCMPANVSIKKGHTRKCHKCKFCPWCYARRIKRIYKLLEKILISNKFCKNLYLASAVQRIIVNTKEALSGEFDLKNGIRSFHKVWRNISRRNDVHGVYAMTTVYPIDEGKNICIENRYFVILSKLKFYEKIKYDYILNPTKEQIAKLVCTVMKYPVSLLEGDPEILAKLFNSIAGCRQTSSFGLFRNGDKPSLSKQVVGPIEGSSA